MTTSPAAIVDALHAHEDGLDIRRRDAVKCLGLQQRGHPVAGHIEAVTLRNSATSYWPVWSQVSSTSSKSLSITMYSRSTAARAVYFRGRPGAIAARASGVRGAYRADELIVGTQFDGTGHQVKGAFVGIAFLE